MVYILLAILFIVEFVKRECQRKNPNGKSVGNSEIVDTLKHYMNRSDGMYRNTKAVRSTH